MKRVSGMNLEHPAVLVRSCTHEEGESAVNQPKPWMRYVDASKVSDATLELDSLKVRNPSGENLGSVDGLIVDSGSGRPLYVVVDAGGWFSSRLFLLPIGELHLDPSREALIASLSRQQISAFPGFDTDEFEKLSEEEIGRINDAICLVYEPGVAPGEPYIAAWTRPAYRTPDWWNSELDVTPASMSGNKPAGNDGLDATDRAQPGDILGIETAGETTHVGDTKEDELERRRDAVEAANRS
jgi:hypothetical protein